MTTDEQLAQLNAAITAIETGAQEYNSGNLHVKLPELKTLYAQRQQLIQQLREEQYGGNITVAEFDRR